jgi:N-acetylglutamate synthase-like GNAT family acetyltransferase
MIRAAAYQGNAPVVPLTPPSRPTDVQASPGRLSQMRRCEALPARADGGCFPERARVDNRGVQITVRRAREEDQPVISAMVRRARLNPADLHWERFVIAERDSRTVGVAQLRRHADGAIELASLVVEPDARRRGIAVHMVDALLADEQAPVYTLIDRRFVEHFTRWGFAPIDPGQLPRSVYRGYRIGRVVTAVGSVLRRQRIRLVPLRCVR